MMQELSMNILDIAENSVRAEATLIEITIDEQPKKDSLTVLIKDNGKGMSPEQLEQVTDPFFTTRTTRDVGLGIPFFRMAAELTGGEFNITSTPGEGTVVAARFVRSSIDLMPLGNINETISVLVFGNPDIDFLYTRQLGDKVISMDTRDFRRILENVPFSDSRVSIYIREFLDENTQELLNEQQ